MGIATLADKQQIIQSLKDTSGKYSKPFEKGKMARTSFLGGNWEEYAQIIMSMVMADTLLDIQSELERLNENITKLVTVQPPALPAMV
jgi:hypothetical protein